MKQISAGSGAPRYTLYFPIQLHRLALPLDLSHLCKELGFSLATGVELGSGRGWEQMTMGPFASEHEARIAFQKTIRALTALCIEQQYPIYFHQELLPLRKPSHRLTVGLDTSKLVDWFADLAYPVIVPEHQYVLDSGISLGYVNPQLSTEKLSTSLKKFTNSSSPIPARLIVAFEAYVIACASSAPMMRFLGLVMTLESLCEKQTRTDDEISALTEIKEVLKNSDVAEKSTTHSNMYGLIAQAIADNREFSITAQMKKLVKAHIGTIEQHLSADNPCLKNLDQSTAQLYKVRSNIVHTGTWALDHETIGTVLAFAAAAAKGVLLDELSLTG